MLYFIFCSVGDQPLALARHVLLSLSYVAELRGQPYFIFH
jgi:hypothetical protein